MLELELEPGVLPVFCLWPMSLVLEWSLGLELRPGELAMFGLWLQTLFQSGCWSLSSGLAHSQCFVPPRRGGCCWSGCFDSPIP